MSYVSQQFLNFDNGSLATFKNWAQAISTALSSAGWTQTTDTGQVNWGTIVAVPTAGNFVYEIWQPGDALQTGSTKLFLKFLYGTSSSSGPRFQFQVGTGTNGSGTLNGFTSSLTEPSASNENGQGSAATFECNFSGDTNRFAMMLWRNLGAISGQVTMNFLFWIERTHNTDGTDSSDGFTYGILSFAPGGGGANQQQTLVFGVGAATTYFRLLSIQNAGTALNQAFNNNIPIQPIFPEYGKIGNPITGSCVVGSSLVASGTEFTTTLYGSTRTYMGYSTSNAPTNGITCMRFD